MFYFIFLLVCDFFFVDWFFALKINYPPDVSESIYNSVYGEIKYIKEFINKKKIENEQNQKVEIRSDVATKI